VSKGLGKWEREILAAVEAIGLDGERVHAAVTVHDITRAWDLSPTNAKRKAAIRAMHSFARKFPQYALMGGNGRKPLMLYDRDDPISVRHAELVITKRGRNSDFVSFGEAADSLAASPPRAGAR
jgi:hypothetical protein